MTANWALIISFIALAVSAFTFYRNYIAPFDPLITVGGAVFHFAKAAPTAPGLDQTSTDEFDPMRDRLLGAVLIPMVFTHEGGKPGVISDVILRVSRRGHNDNWIFEPRLNVDERAYLTSFDAQGHLRWMESAFSPIAISKGSQQRRFIMFQASNNPLFPSGRLRLAHYSIHVLARINKEKQYREIDEIAVDFTSEVLNGLGVERYLPPPESISELRDKLKHK